MSGETWSALWATRSCSEELATWAMNSSGIMLFLHSDRIRCTVDIGTNNAMIRAMGEQPEDGDFRTWSPDK